MNITVTFTDCEDAGMPEGRAIVFEGADECTVSQGFDYISLRASGKRPPVQADPGAPPKLALAGAPEIGGTR